MDLRPRRRGRRRPSSKSAAVFALISVLPVLLLGAVLLEQAHAAADERVLGRGRAQAQLVQTMGVGPALMGADLNDLATADFLRLRQVTQVAVVEGAVRFVAVLDLEGRVMFSEGRSVPDFSSPDDVAAIAAAEQGTTAVRLAPDLDAPSGSHIRVALPLKKNTSGISTGVLELGLPYEDIAASAARDLRKTYITLGVALLGLYFAQSSLAWWTTGRLRRLASENEHRALHDALTSLPNRRLFQLEVEAALARTRSGGRPCALVLVDLDHFKVVNDTLGHAAGDALLCATADRLVLALRSDDVVARLGGDEFGIVLDGIDDAATAEELLREVQCELARELMVQGVPLSVQASWGVALAPSGAEDVASLLQRADEAMYDAKRAGSGVVSVWGASARIRTAN